MANGKKWTLDERSDSGPERSVWGAFSQTDGSERGNGNGHHQEPPKEESSRAWSGPVTEAVGLANKIINEQIELGKKVASELNEQISGSGTGAANFGGFGSAPQDFAEAMFNSFTELSKSWFHLMADMSSAWMGMASPNGGTQEPQADAANFELRTRRDASISGNLEPMQPGATLVAGPLHSSDGTSPPLTDVRTASYPPFVTVTIPEAQPPGVYFGAVFDKAAGKTVGSITVSLRDQPVVR